MKLKNEVFNEATYQALDKLVNQDIDVSITWDIKKNIGLINPIVTNLNDMQQKIAQKFSKKDKDGKQIHMKDKNDKPIRGRILIEDINAYNKEIDKLMNIENEVDIIPIDIKKLKEHNVKLSVQNLIALDFMIKEI